MKKSSARTVYLIGGTTEANLAAGRLQREGYRIVVSVATELGEGVAAAAGLETDAGMKDATAIAAGARANGALAIVDCSHPFARVVSDEAARAAEQSGLPYLRHTRPPASVRHDNKKVSRGIKTTIDATRTDIRMVETFEAAASLLRERGGRALLTVGVRQLQPFVEAGIEFTARILPLAESFDACASLGIPPAGIIAAWPPFSVDFNRACLRHSRSNTLVTKESGREGGLGEKIQAAADEDAAVIMIARPADPGAIHDLDELVARLGQVAGSAGA